MNRKDLFGLAAITALAVVPAMAADQGSSGQPLKGPDHLLPLDGNGISLYQGYSEFLGAVAPKRDYGLSSVYIWPASKPGVYLAIYQTEDEKAYYLLYAQDTKPKATVSTLTVPEVFAREFSDDLATIIQTGTRYDSDWLGLIRCTDGTEYVFESAGYDGRAGCPATGEALQLELVAEQLIELAGMQSAAPEQQDAKRKLILSEMTTESHPAVPAE